MRSVQTTNKHVRTNRLILGAFLLYFFGRLLYSLPRDIINGIDDWAYTDWLIDYSAGFTRRGLSGELIGITSTFVHPKAVIGILTWVIFCAVVFGYVRLIKRSLETLSPFLLTAILFLPSLLPFYLYDEGAFGRKETIGFLILLWHLYILESQVKYSGKGLATNNYIKKLLFITVILLPTYIFIHESAFFLFVPVHAIITYSILRLDPSLSFTKRITYLILIYSPILLAFSVVLFFGRPSLEVALAICKRWELAKALEAGSCRIRGKDMMWALPSSFTALPWSFSQAASLVLSFSVKTILTWITVLFVLGFSTIKIGIMTGYAIAGGFPENLEATLTRQYQNIMSYKYFLLPLLLSAPLYIMGWDIGRWFAVTCISYIIIMLSVEINYAEFKLSNGTAAKDKTPAELRIGGQNVLLDYAKWLLLLSIVFFIRLPHCCIEYNVFSEPFQSLIKKIINLL
jgi:hypothetical protein